MPPLTKGAMVACGNRLSPTEADSGDGDRVSGGGIYLKDLKKRI